MPNYVYHVLTVTVKTQKQKEIVLKEWLDEKGNFDFNKFVPMPKELNMEDGTLTDIATAYYLSKEFTRGITIEEDEYYSDCEIFGKKATNLNRALTRLKEDIVKKDWNGKLFGKQTLEEVYELGKQYVSNKDKYGARTWYNWCCENWGTKWGAVDTEVEEIDEETIVIRYATAWSMPEPIFRKMAEMYPDIKWENEAEEEGFAFAGVMYHEPNKEIYWVDETEERYKAWKEENEEYEEDEEENEA